MDDNDGYRRKEETNMNPIMKSIEGCIQKERFGDLFGIRIAKSKSIIDDNCYANAGYYFDGGVCHE